MSNKSWFPAWRLTLSDPDEDTGEISATLTGWPGTTPPGDAPLLSRAGPRGRYWLYSNVDRSDPDTDEVLFKPGVLEYLRMSCPVCGDELVISNPRPRPKRLPKLYDGRHMSRMAVWCRECRRSRRE